MTTDEVYYIAGMETDTAGRIIVFGYFSGSIDFGNGAIVSTGGRDIFLAQFDPDGNVLWSHVYGGAGQQYPGALAVNESGKIAITGFVDAAVNFGGGALTPTTPFDPVLAVFTSAGTHSWSKIFNGTGSQFGVGVTWAANEDVLLSCNGTGSIDLGGGVLTGSATKYSVFLGRYFGSTGAHRWSSLFSATNGVRGIVEEDHGKIILAGGVGGDVNFGGGVLTGLAAGDADAYLAEFTDVLYTGVSSPALHASLGQNVPNPFNPETRIDYTLDASAHVMIDVYDAAGALVTQLDDGVEPAGAHAIKWDGRDGRGRSVASGVYFYRLDGMPEAAAKKMVLLK
jgi:hypothetical protein